VSDRRLRELERQWRSTDDPQAEVAYLRELVRSGSLTPNLLSLALYLGYERAHQAVAGLREHPALRGLRFDGLWAQANRNLTEHPNRAVVLPFRRDEARFQGLGRWFFRLREFGLEALLRCTLAAFTRLGPAWIEIEPARGGEYARVLELVKSTVCGQAELARERASTELRGVEVAHFGSRLQVGQVPQAILSALLQAEPSEAAAVLAIAVFAVARPSGFGTANPELEDSVKAAVAKEVVPWALGYGDPLNHS
jgi:hypothetical protein